MRLDFDQMEFQIGNARIIEQMPALPVGTPFEPERINFLNALSKELISDKKARQYPDIATFAFWIRKANMGQERERFLSKNRFRIGRGVVFHITPSNVAVNFAYSFAVSFILGNANIVRLPSKEFPQVDMICQAIRKILDKEEYKKWKEYIAFLKYERNQTINDFFSSICDMRVIWGGDSTIREIRKSELPPKAREITFADRYSICVIDTEKYLEIKDKDKIAYDFYNDTYLTDQNACTSPRLVCWLGKKEIAGEAKKLFWDKFWNVVSEKYTFQPVQYVDKLVNGCMAATAVEGLHVVKMKDNQIVRMEVEKLNPVIQEYQGNSGVFYECEISDVMELASICNGKVQTVVMVGDKERLVPLVKSGVKGIDRVVDVGKSMEFGFFWDGEDLREQLTRKIDF